MLPVIVEDGVELPKDSIGCTIGAVMFDSVMNGPLRGLSGASNFARMRSSLLIAFGAGVALLDADANIFGIIA